MKKMKALPYLLVKEFKQMFRNRLLPVVFVVLPFVMTNVVPRIMTQEVKNLSFAVVDGDRSTLSTRLVHKMQASDLFTLYAVCPNYKEAYDLLLRDRVDFILTIENDFERKLYRTSGADVMVSVNAVNGMKGGLGSTYLMQLVMQYARQLSEEQGAVVRQPVSVEPRYLYNETLDYKPYMIPALMSMTLILLVGFLPALNVVGEKEQGTIEQISVTPISRLEFILSKMIPYWTVGLVIVALSMLLAKWLHGVTPAGSVVDVVLFNAMFILTISSLGLTVSNHSSTLRQAAIVMFFFIVIFVLTGGLISPISAMPAWAQEATRLNPLRYIITAMREIYLKGSTLRQLLPQFIPLCIYAFVAATWAITSFRKNS